MAVLSGGFVYPGGTFFTGSAIAPLDIVPASYPVAIAGRPYDIEPRLYRRSFVVIQRPSQDDTGEPGEATLSPEALWRRSQSDWGLGAGQLWLDEEESVRRRFRTSLGVDVFNDRELTLLPATEEKRNTASSTIKLLTCGDRLYVKDGTVVLFGDAVNSEQAATWAFTTSTGHPGALDIAFSGSHVYILGTDNSIWRATPGTTAFTLFYNPTAVATRIWAALGRLFMSDGDQLWEVTATPGEVLIFTHPDPFFVISHLCGSPTGIYFAGNTSQKGEVRHAWIKEDGTTFTAPVVAAEFINEQVNVCAAVSGVILIGTSVGFRFSRIDGLTTGLAFGAVVSVGAVRDIVYDTVTGDATTYAWFTWTAIESGVSGTGRIRLNRFTEPEVPAYASDVATASGATCMSVASIRGRRYYALATDGFYGANANRVATGTLSTGRIRFGILDRKNFSDLSWRTAPLAGTIDAIASFDDGATQSAGSQNIAGTVELEGAQIGPVTAEWAEITFTFTRSTLDATQGPTMRWWLMRALAAPTGSIKFVVPLRLTEKIQTPRGPAKVQDFLEELDFLHALVNARATVRYQEGHASYDVYVSNIELQPEQWNAMDHGLEGICLVEMISLR